MTTIVNMTTRELIDMFDKINSDCSEELYVPLTDIDYYSEQLMNLYENDGIEITEKEALNLATDIALMSTQL